MKFRGGSKTGMLVTIAGVTYVCLCVLSVILPTNLLASSSLSFSPEEAAFGTVVIGETKNLGVQVTNVSGEAAAITSISIEGFSSFSVSNKCPAEIPAGASCTIVVSFHPVSGGGYHGEQTAILVFYDGTTVLASLHANGHAL
ncbi:MAG TPA: choice-of-anchor D domain-containing protein [Terriglobia bacterium]